MFRRARNNILEKLNTKINNMKLTLQETSDLTLACETLMEQLHDDLDIPSFKEKYYRIWDLRIKLNKK